MIKTVAHKVKSHTYLDYIAVLQISNEDDCDGLDVASVLEDVTHTVYVCKQARTLEQASQILSSESIDVCVLLEPTNGDDGFVDSVCQLAEQLGDKVPIVAVNHASPTENSAPTRCHIIFDKISYSSVNSQSLARTIFNAVRLKKCEIASLEAIKTQATFFSSLSHELRTPLNAVIGFSNRLLKKSGTSFSESDIKSLNCIHRNGKTLLNAINELLELSKARSMKINLFLEKFDVNDLMEEVINRLSVIADEHNLYLELCKIEQSITIKSDWQRLSQVLVNLVSNGIKYTEVGGVTLSASQVHDAKKGDCILFKVKDTGIGIAEQDLEAIFDEYQTVDSKINKKVDSTGLGLPLTALIVDTLDGELNVESALGEGSVFTALIPLSAAVE